MGIPGKLVPPYPVENCANADCPHGSLTDRDAFLYRDQDDDTLVIFCDDCARHAEINAPLRFLLIAL
jgi:hypothetical protein